MLIGTAFKLIETLGHLAAEGRNVGLDFSQDVPRRVVHVVVFGHAPLCLSRCANASLDVRHVMTALGRYCSSPPPEINVSDKLDG
jgi:hypothetical protein